MYCGYQVSEHPVSLREEGTYHHLALLRQDRLQQPDLFRLLLDQIPPSGTDCTRAGQETFRRSITARLTQATTLPEPSAALHSGSRGSFQAEAVNDLREDLGWRNEAVGESMKLDLRLGCELHESGEAVSVLRSQALGFRLTASDPPRCLPRPLRPPPSRPPHLH